MSGRNNWRLFLWIVSEMIWTWTLLIPVKPVWVLDEAGNVPDPWKNMCKEAVSFPDNLLKFFDLHLYQEIEGDLYESLTTLRIYPAWE